MIPMAETVDVKQKKKKNFKDAFQEESESDSGAEQGEDKDLSELNPRKANKKLVKAEKRERRK